MTNSDLTIVFDEKGGADAQLVRERLDMYNIGATGVSARREKGQRKDNDEGRGVTHLGDVPVQADSHPDAVEVVGPAQSFHRAPSRLSDRPEPSRPSDALSLSAQAVSGGAKLSGPWRRSCSVGHVTRRS